MTLFLRYAAKSDVGMVRRENEDSGFAGRSLLAVADGMGGHAAGELASSTAIATLAELDSEDLPAEDLLTALDDAVITAAERISQFIDADPSRAGMGTTVTAMLWQAGRIAMIHVGDSRAYLLRDGELTQITHDHTYVQSLVDAGRITAEEARRHPKRNLVIRAIDGNQLPEGETSVRQAQAGDRYLLCSDGLSGVLEDSVIAGVLREVPDPTAAVSALVDLALEGGAPDNVTAVLADVVAADDAEIAREAALASAVVVGAAGEARNRAALPGLAFPDDVGPDGQAGGRENPLGPAVAGGLAMRAGSRGQDDAADEGEGAEAVAVGGRVTARTPPGEVADDDAEGQFDEDDHPSEPADPGETAEDSRPGFVRRHAGWLAAGAVLVAGLLVGVAGFLWWLGAQWYVGSQDGYVTVFQGVPQTLVGAPLSRPTTQTTLLVTSLPYYDQQQLMGTIEAATQADADRIVADLELKAAACAAFPAPSGCPPTSLGTPGSATPSATPDPSAAAALLDQQLGSSLTDGTSSP